jgi:hypothetical protein
MKSALFPAALACALAALLGAAQASAAPSEPTVIARDTQLTLTLPTSPQAGKPLDFKLTVKNKGTQALDIPFATGQMFDTEIREGDAAAKGGDPSKAKLLWNWAADRLFTQALTTLHLEPGQERAFAVKWKGQANGGAAVPPGTYTVRAVLTPVFKDPRLATAAPLALKP